MRIKILGSFGNYGNECGFGGVFFLLFRDDLCDCDSGEIRQKDRLQVADSINAAG